MNTFFRICVAIYSFISMIFFAIVAISPFGEKTIMAKFLDYFEINLYQSNKYDVLVFIIGLVFFLISIAILTSGIRGKRDIKYASVVNDKGSVKISSTSIENIALAMSKRFQGVKEARAKAIFDSDEIKLVIKLQVYTDVNIPELCGGIQDRVKEAVESCTDIKVSNIAISVDGASVQNQ